MRFRRFLSTLSGDDDGIIERCDARTKNRFAGIGLFVALIFAVCALSSYAAFTNLFPNPYVAAPVALFFAWMIFNIYLLMLYTLSKSVLPQKNKDKSRVLSVILRAAFICLIAAVVSKPLEAWIFKTALDAETAAYKAETLDNYSRGINEFYAGETALVEKMLADRRKLTDRNLREKESAKYRILLESKQTEKNAALSEMSELVENSNFYVFGITTLNRKYPACWLLTLLCISLFLIPAALKNFLSEKSDYYRRKKKIETHIVRDEYLEFKANYRRILRDKFGEDINSSEPFADAPFNTKLKKDPRKFLSEQALLDELYDA